DEGSGYDAKLTTLYKSFKAGKRHLRGKFGEGTKMNETHFVRNGAKIKMRSHYPIPDQNRERAWQRHGYVDEEKIVRLKGIEVDLPEREDTEFGSSTFIEISHANEKFKQDFIKNIDPRSKGDGLATN